MLVRLREVVTPVHLDHEVTETIEGDLLVLAVVEQSGGYEDVWLVEAYVFVEVVVGLNDPGQLLTIDHDKPMFGGP